MCSGWQSYGDDDDDDDDDVIGWKPVQDYANAREGRLTDRHYYASWFAKHGQYCPKLRFVSGTTMM